MFQISIKHHLWQWLIAGEYTIVTSWWVNELMLMVNENFGNAPPPTALYHNLSHEFINYSSYVFRSVLASSLVFNLADGQFSSRADLIDAPGSSLGRGAQVAGLGELKTCHILLLLTCGK